MCIFEYNEEEVLKLIRSDEREIAREEVRDEVIAEVRKEILGEVREEVRGEVREEVRGEVREEVRGEVREEILGEVREEILEEVREEVRGEILKEVNEKIQDANYKLVKIVCKMFLKGNSIKDMADLLEENEDYIKSICDIAKLSAPDYDVDAIYKQVLKQHFSNTNQATESI